MSEEEAIKLLKYKIINVDTDIYIDDLDKTNIEAIKIVLNKNIKQKEVLDKIRKNNKRIIDYGFDYDGFNNVEDLKKLIDMLVDYAKQNDKLLEEIK